MPLPYVKNAQIFNFTDFTDVNVFIFELSCGVSTDSAHASKLNSRVPKVSDLSAKGVTEVCMIEPSSSSLNIISKRKNNQGSD